MSVRTGKGAKLFVVDGSATEKTLEISPMEANVSFEEGTTFNVFKHRGNAIPDGEGMVEAERENQALSFAYMLTDLGDTVCPFAVLRWSQGDTSSTTAVIAAGWTSTTTRTDGRKTLTYRYYPAGNGAGAAYYEFPDCLVETDGFGEGNDDATVKSVTARSTTADRATYVAAT